MMKLLDRAKPVDKHARRTNKSMTIDGTSPHGQYQNPASISQRSDTTPRRRIAREGRPQTADNDVRHSKLARMSFFEAFAIGTGEDTFSFPKPTSAKAAQKEFEILTTVVSTHDRSSLIGIAIGSPSQAPHLWNQHLPMATHTADTSPSTAGLNIAFEDNMPHQMEPQVQSTPKWKKVSGLFRRGTKSTMNEAKSMTKQRSDGHIAEKRPNTSNGLLRTKSQGAKTLVRTRTVEDLKRQSRPNDKVDAIHVLRPTKEIRTSSDGLHESSPCQPARWSMEATTLLGVDKICQDDPYASHDTKFSQQIAQVLPKQAPRIELQLPSCHMERFSIMFEDVLDVHPALLDCLPNTDVKDADGMHDPPQLTAVAANERPLLDRSLTSSLVPQVVSGDHSAQYPATTSFHKPLPALRRANTTPLLSPPRVTITTPSDRPAQHLQTFFESPTSPDDETALPRTPPQSAGSDTVHVVTGSPIDEHVSAPKLIKKAWQSVLPASPGSATSTHFSVDVHRPLDSPRLMSRARSFDALRSPTRHAHVAIARKVSVSKAQHEAQTGGANHQCLKPRMIRVTSRKNILAGNSN